MRTAPLLLALLGSATSLPPARAQVTTLQSKSAAGAPGNAESRGAALTPDGRYVAFASKASNLVSGDTNGVMDVFLRDRQTGQVDLVSRGIGGVPGNGDSGTSAISGGHVALSDDGRYVAFVSKATNLVSGDTNGQADVFLRDRLAGVNVLVSKPPGGGQSNEDSMVLGGKQWMSSDGRWIAFESSASNLLGTAPGVSHVYRWDRMNGALQGVSANVSGVPGNGNSFGPSLSGDGNFVAFESMATNLLAGFSGKQVYVRDMTSGVVHPVSATSAGVAGNGQSSCDQISRDARYVVFTSLATNLVSGDTNGARDVFVRDFWTLSTTRVSVSSTGVQGNSDSADGSLSEFGRFVAFRTSATNLLVGFGSGDQKEDLLRRDLLTNLVVPISATPGGQQGNGESTEPVLSSDGRWCVFVSKATDLVSGGTSSVGHVLLRELESCPAVTPYCVGKSNSAGCLPQMVWWGTPSLSDGQSLFLLGASVVNQSLGLLVYGTDGPALIPFGGGVLCVAPPILRGPVSPTGGNLAGNDCSGLLVTDFEAYAKSGADPQLVAGAIVDVQCWYRDVQSSFGVGLTNALQLELCP